MYCVVRSSSRGVLCSTVLSHGLRSVRARPSPPSVWRFSGCSLMTRTQSEHRRGGGSASGHWPSALRRLCWLLLAPLHPHEGPVRELGPGVSHFLRAVLSQASRPAHGPRPHLEACGTHTCGLACPAACSPAPHGCPISILNLNVNVRN